MGNRPYNLTVSWGMYLGSIAFFTVVLGVFYAIAWSVLLGIYENYQRYYQKADLQWTGSKSRVGRKRISFSRLIVLAFVTAWIVVHFIVFPH